MENKYREIKNWPFVEARKILDRIGNHTPEKGYVLFETGYGPSGLPHRRPEMVQGFSLLDHARSYARNFNENYWLKTCV